MLADAIDKVGKDGTVTVEESNTFGLELEFTEGMQFDKGFLSPYFVTDPERQEAVLEDPSILLVDSKVSAVHDLLPVLEKVMQTGKPLLLIVEDVEGEALATLVVNKIRGTFQSVVVKAPAFGERRKATLADMAILTGGQVVSEEVGLKLESVTLDVLGRARCVVVTKDDTTIVEGAGKAADVKARIAQIRREIDETDSDWDREKSPRASGEARRGVAVVRSVPRPRSSSRRRSTASRTRSARHVPRSKKGSWLAVAQRSSVAGRPSTTERRNSRATSRPGRRSSPERSKSRCDGSPSTLASRDR